MAGRSMADLARRFLFVTGKGGVGKTTVAASLAIALARQGKRVLVTAVDAKERLSTLFGVPPLPTQIARIADDIWGVKLVPEVALREYGQLILKSRAVYNAVFDNRYVRSFFAGVPGLYEWSMLGKAWFHSVEELPDGRPRFDVVLFDAPATGHGLDMLRVPKVIVDVVPPGVLRRDAEAAWRMFRDPEQSGVVVVTLPEDMPTNETVELMGTLKSELALPIARLVVNGVMEPLFSETERHELLKDRDLDRAEPGDEAIACGIRRAIRERVQEQSLRRLRELAAPRTELPLLTSEAARPEALVELAGHFRLESDNSAE
jgi:anion-transporting  ArsA/GET3 family ATPase